VVPTVCCARPTHGTARVMAAEVVSHAFSQGFHPEHSQPVAWSTNGCSFGGLAASSASPWRVDDGALSHVP
jgi:hypothetical protein